MHAHTHIFHSLGSQNIDIYVIFSWFSGFLEQHHAVFLMLLTQICCFQLCFPCFWIPIYRPPLRSIGKCVSCLVFGCKKWRKHHQSYMYGTFWDKKCDIHVRSEFSILRHKKHNLLLYNVVLRGWQLRMHTYTNKVRIQQKPGSLPVAAHWFFQMYLFWK